MKLNDTEYYLPDDFHYFFLIFLSSFKLICWWWIDSTNAMYYSKAVWAAGRRKKKISPYLTLSETPKAHLHFQSLTLMSASSSSGVTQGCLSRKEAFSRVILVFWLLSNGCSSALNARPPQTRKRTTTMNTASTVFHFITEWSAATELSQLASMLATTLAEREEMDRRGRGQWPLVLGSQPVGFCMVATLAWTRLDFAKPDWTFLGGTKLVWTATGIEERED